MVTTRQAVQDLRDAISTVRGVCGADPNCKDLLRAMNSVEDEALSVSYGAEKTEDQPGYQLRKALEDAENAADKMFGGPFGDDKADADDKPLPDLKSAAARARQVFAARRKADRS